MTKYRIELHNKNGYEVEADSIEGTESDARQYAKEWLEQLSHTSEVVKAVVVDGSYEILTTFEREVSTEEEVEEDNMWEEYKETYKNNFEADGFAPVSFEEFKAGIREIEFVEGPDDEFVGWATPKPTYGVGGTNYQTWEEYNRMLGIPEI